MKALVTGSAGFIGKHVSRALLADGFSVTGFDQKETDEPGVDSIIGDFLDIDSLTPAVKGHDVVVHIGAIGDVYLAATNPELAAAVNVTGTTNIALAIIIVVMVLLIEPTIICVEGRTGSRLPRRRTPKPCV